MGVIKKILRVVMVGLALVALAMFVWLKFLRRPAVIVPDLGQVADFSLLDQTGSTVTRDSLKDKTWVANFIFTRCMGPCPLITLKASELQKEFTNSKFALVSFSVDPEFDTPKVLAAYAESYHPDPARWHFLTGDKQKIFELIRTSFHLAIQNDKPEDPNAILHSTMFILVGPDGHIRGYYNSTDVEAFNKLRGDLHTQFGS